MAEAVSFHVDYDAEGDVLYVFRGAPYPTTNVELDANFTLRLDPKTQELVGLTILDYSSIFPRAGREEEQALVAASLMQTFRQLHQEQKLKEPLSA